jgi:Zn-dependent oligopeptidase
MSDKEYITFWGDKKLAEKFKQAQTEEAQAKIALEVIEQKKIDFRQELELLKESELVFRAVCITHKNELQKVYAEQAKLLETMWCEMGDAGIEVRKHAQQLANEISPIKQQVSDLRQEVDSLKKELSSFRIYDAEKLTGLVKSIEGMSEGTKSIMQFLLSEYKK